MVAPQIRWRNQDQNLMLRSEELSITTRLLDSTIRCPLHLDNGGDFAELCNAKVPKVCPKGDEMSGYKEGMGTQNVPNKTNCDGVSSIIFRCENGYIRAPRGTMMNRPMSSTPKGTNPPQYINDGMLTLYGSAILSGEIFSQGSLGGSRTTCKRYDLNASMRLREGCEKKGKLKHCTHQKSVIVNLSKTSA